ncbi:PSP1 domain-containing protein [Urechidicola vernalis]|uniref:Regulatory iron-sulfur-containing complex subunit RicT n=1 Tax=Urechidicola vernalis TaxID=3075600 RepID=A0ABU2Y8G3_9FLAO|nr:regulatory iron-sulfur-containing complex subunit RicT [Urechidicola sp. P050]MDT0553348.1 regulatory iron-sulfur-containing complex subunit RicT [Urechidicola sp. P050]
MGCNSCSTTKDGVPKGCKSNGNCGTGSCDKLTVFDWLSNMTLPSGQEPFNIVEVRFKNGRKHFYKNEGLQLCMGEVVTVEGSPGHDVGTVSLTGELVRIQMKKKGVAIDSEDVKKIYRKSSVRDIDIWEKARDKEIETQRRGREILGRLGLKMKLSDVEYQGDGNKATFYYTADERVDFRQLIRDLASAFSIRVEMKQVGLRQEAARLGGVGSCGRELCCSTWLTDFRKVNTASARYQQLSLNPQKLSGQCGKLKCCLNFELDSYLDAIKSFPKKETVLKTDRGDAVFVKMDIFKEEFWYTYKDESFKWYKLDLEQLKEIVEANKGGETVSSLEDYELDAVSEKKVSFEDAVGEDSLTRFDQPKRNKRRRNKRKPGKKPQHQNKQKGGQKEGGQKERPKKQQPQGNNKNPNQGNNRNKRRKPRPKPNQNNQKDA